MIKRIILILFFFIIFLNSFIFSQEISEKHDVSIFKLGAYEWNIPRGALGGIDEEIKGKFISLGRFNVIGMNQRFNSDDIDDFIRKIKEIKQQNVEIPDEYKTGEDILTESDFNQLIGSFYVVIPVVSQFDIAFDENENEYIAEIKTSFTILHVETGDLEHFFVETSGQNKNKDFSINEAIDGIPPLLEYELQKLFAILSAVLDVRGGELDIALGKNMGLRPGSEFFIINPEITSGGYTFDRKTGLIIVKDVGEESSIATLLYGSPSVGDQLQEVPRVGFEIVPYLDIMTDPFRNWELSMVGGIRMSWTKGLYWLRPFIGVELPIPLSGGSDAFLRWLYHYGLPINAYVGGEVNFYLRRLQITPQLAFGVGFFVPYKAEDKGEEEKYVTHLGGYVNLNLNYLVIDRVKITINAGYKIWFCLYDRLFNKLKDEFSLTYGGIMLGFGVTIKI